MAVIQFPTNLVCDKFSFGQKRNDIAFSSSFGTQAVEISPPWFTATLSAPQNYENLSGGWQSLIMSLRGSTNQLALWHLGRPQPLGTMRGSMTLSSNAAAGATSLVITAGSGQAAKTLKQGDILGVGSGITTQCVMVVADAVADGSGVITVTTEPALRNAFPAGAAVTWDKPVVLYRKQGGGSSSWDYDMNMSSGYTLTLQEDPRP